MPSSHKNRCLKITRFLLAAPVLLLALRSDAADRFWDGGAANLATDGDGLASSFTSGTWNTALTNWDQGAGLPHVAWNNANLDTAIFGGTYAASGAIRVIDLTADITVNQIKILVGSTANNRYDIGGTGETNSLTFGGTYDDATPSIDFSPAQTTAGHNNNINAKITGTISGGLVVRYQSDIAAPAASGRLNFTNASNDFLGDVTLLGGNLHMISNLGNALNKIILKGGAIFTSNGGAIVQTNARNIEIAAASGIGTNYTGSGVQAMQFTGAITGSGNWTRYSSSATQLLSEVRLQGDMSGYTGIFENRGGLVVAQTTATSGGAWKLTGGALKLDAANNDAIASGAGKSDLLMNGGTLNVNGKSETINGLSGATGFVQNDLAASNSNLTIGDGDATASFGGTIRNNGGTGGDLALTKIGAGAQTLTGVNSYTGLTTVTAGSLLVSGSLTGSNVTVSGTLGGSGTINGSVGLTGGTIDPGGDLGDRTLDIGGLVDGSGTLSLTIDSMFDHDRITGSGLLDVTNLTLSVTMNDSGWVAATNAAGLATATQYDIFSNSGLGNFTNGTLLSAAQQTYWGVGADAKFFNFGGQDFLLTTDNYNLTAVTIPEPSGMISLLVAAGLLVLRRQRRAV